MTSFENPNMGTPSGEYAAIPIPAHIDSEWCQVLSEAYRQGNSRAIVEVPHFLATELTPGCQPGSTHQRFMTTHLIDSEALGFLVDGRIKGARMMPRPKPANGMEVSGRLDFEYKPYLVLADVEDIHGGVMFFMGQPEKEMLVPINELDDNLLIYEDSGAF